MVGFPRSQDGFGCWKKEWPLTATTEHHDGQTTQQSAVSVAVTRQRGRHVGKGNNSQPVDLPPHLKMTSL
ncbi:hypothetical protein AMECASPLE_022420 [Ameca splendens]|uniref:Uncharacterized protein n=1 Tax=Ameca splendens TaxID=208324 RepID=A0ABV0ZCN5_9TELE